LCVSLERGEVQTQETHELMCDDCDSLVLAPEEKRHRPSALSYAEHDPPTANVTLFSRRAWNMADLAEELGELRRPSQLPPLRAFRRSVTERRNGAERSLRSSAQFRRWKKQEHCGAQRGRPGG
jgi:hypothetical protein